jgi:DNA-directed RNA polymerase sigma subunit (sigma70/sigma32)
MTPLIKVKSAYLKCKDNDEILKEAREELRASIIEARAQRYTLQAIADVLQVTQQRVNQIIKGTK